MRCGERPSETPVPIRMFIGTEHVLPEGGGGGGLAELLGWAHPTGPEATSCPRRSADRVTDLAPVSRLARYPQMRMARGVAPVAARQLSASTAAKGGAGALP